MGSESPFTPLHPKQEQALQLVRRFAFLYGRPATIRELADLMGVASVNGVAYHLAALCRRRFLKRVDGGPWKTVYLPAEPRLVVEPTLIGVRVGTTGPAVELTPAEWLRWLRSQLALYGEAA
jgi:SOS-response transcriptional repressor LexA